MPTLYTIGFTGKSARQFFKLLQEADVATLTDTRINNTSQLSGFAKGNDLAFFAKAIGNMRYEHVLEFAPTKELLARYRAQKISWQEYETEYLNLLDLRKITSKVDVESLHRHCLLCSEHGPEQCHRRLLAEYFQQKHRDVEIVHLM
jgi:uncharacterized protein (DUF488 family)